MITTYIHPESVVKAWYAADCPPNFNPRPHISRLDCWRWMIARLLNRAS